MPKNNFVVFFYLLFILFVISEILLLKNYFEMQRELESLKMMKPILYETQKKQFQRNEQEKWYGKKIPQKIIGNRKNVYFVLVLFKQNDCYSCLENVFYQMNQLYRIKKNDKWNIIGLTRDSLSKSGLRVLKDKYKITFKLITSKDFYNKISLINKSPILLFGNNQNRQVLYSYYPSPDPSGVIKFFNLITQFEPSY